MTRKIYANGLCGVSLTRLSGERRGLLLSGMAVAAPAKATERMAVKRMILAGWYRLEFGVFINKSTN
jgi:hypothetical protein